MKGDMSDIYILGIDIGGTKTVLSAIDSEGYPHQKRRLSSIDIFQSGKPPALSLAGCIRQYCADFEIQMGHLQGIVVGFPGIMDYTAQVIASCPNLTELDRLPLGQLLMDQVQVPVLVENDVNLIAVGEQYRGAGKGVQDLACVMVGSGIGCGLIINGKLYRGADGVAGEFGHIIIQHDGRLCTCGSRGCLEMYCSGKALSYQSQIIFGSKDNTDQAIAEPADWRMAEEVIKAARAGHPQAKEAIQTAFRFLGLGLANLANILNPRLILLGGGILTGWPEGLDIVRNTVQENARVVVKDHIRIEPTILAEQASFAGAFILTQQSLNHSIGT